MPRTVEAEFDGKEFGHRRAVASIDQIARDTAGVGTPGLVMITIGGEMRLRRSGAKRYHGETELFDARPSVQWDGATQTVYLGVRDVPDGLITYNYDLAIPISEVRQILKLIANKGLLQSGPGLAVELAKSSSDLAKLLVASTGLGCLNAAQTDE